MDNSNLSYVKVKVDEQVFEMTAQDVSGSNTLQDLLQYNNKQLNEPIVIGMSMNKWQDYLRFLQFGDPTVHALQVINYLDNVQQAKIWCDNKYALDSNNCSNNGSVVNRHEGQQHNIVLDNMFNIILTHTAYEPEEIVVFWYTTNIKHMYRYISKMQTLPRSCIEHILGKLYNQQILNIYREAIVNKRFDDLSRDNSNGHDMIQTLIANKFIIRLSSSQGLCYHGHQLLRSDNDNNALDIGVSCMSPRVAQYYSTGGNVWQYGDNNSMLYYRNGNGIIQVRKSNCEGKILNFYCSDKNSNDHDDISQYLKMVPKHVTVDKDNGYHPTLIGIKTGIKIGDYTLNIYNPPSTHDRDYYLLLPYEYNPIDKIIHVFSL